MPTSRSNRFEINRASRRVPFGAIALALAAIAASAGSASGQNMGPDFAADYVITNLGSVDDVPTSYGGLVFKLGDPSTLLLGGNANSPNAVIMSLSVRRAANGSIVGFDCADPVPFSAAPHIDGGLCYAPNGTLLYTTYSNNSLGQILPGSVAPDRVDNLDAYGVLPSTGTLAVVPPGFSGAGRLKIASYSFGAWYDATLSPAGGGLWDFDVTNEGFDGIAIGGGPEGIAYVRAGSPGFAADSVLVSLFAAGQIRTYEIDGNGDPIVATGRVFVDGLAGAEGATIDPVTGDFLFSTFGGFNNLIKVSGFDLGGCTADLNFDGVVDGDDLGSLLGEWNTTGASPADLTGNCFVDGDDLGTLLGQWGPCSL